MSALLFAVHIVYVSKFSGTNDVLVLTVMQFFIGGACGVACGACFETLSPAWALTPEFFWNMAYLVIFASCVALVIQNVALAHVPPAQASLFLRLESVFGVLFSVLLYGEQVGLKLIVGFVLIFGAILVSEMFPLKRRTLQPINWKRCRSSCHDTIAPNVCSKGGTSWQKKTTSCSSACPAPANLPSASCWRRS